MKPGLLALLVCLATVVPAQAQIYTWRDAAGALVVSNKPRADGDPGATYLVPGTTTIKTTSKPEKSGQDTSAYDDLIRLYAERYHVSPDLVRAVIQAESAFNRWAISPKGAMGLMQLMPATARDLGVNDPFHPEQNIRGGVAYLAGLMTRFDQNVELALAAYNAGAERVERYDGVPPYRETRDYVRKITANAGEKVLAPPPPPPIIYKWLDLVDGKPFYRYSNVPPQGVAYEVVKQR